MTRYILGRVTLIKDVPEKHSYVGQLKYSVNVSRTKSFNFWVERQLLGDFNASQQPALRQDVIKTLIPYALEWLEATHKFGLKMPKFCSFRNQSSEIWKKKQIVFSHKERNAIAREIFAEPFADINVCMNVFLVKERKSSVTEASHLLHSNAFMSMLVTEKSFFAATSRACRKGHSINAVILLLKCSAWWWCRKWGQ